ncbi:Gfo/Idh/MocA family oxidoreductase [Thalassomonas viridans]|uniref:Gfo/Idh/MocA family oxidoreductase n=1 Tax=Thalassomonas viridans TaxID=137584 RepID=A0AAE9ZA09_9GAMM|nr:Gfo/Idh/MocA family oxidoreductase [Thalassomonas viridans]WDE08992.1 Gfo/Idh/MocA family oxidoreductase [Thalassomonas viridans]
MDNYHTCPTRVVHPVIVGFGHAGRNLHLSSINKIRKENQPFGISPGISIVENNADVQALSLPENSQCFNALPRIDFYDPEKFQPVVHICSPPSSHLRLIKEAIAKGYHKIIVEKPVTETVAESNELIRIKDESRAEILVVANWVHSALTANIEQVVRTGKYGKIRKIEIVQNKPRFCISKSRENEHLFHIEIPHQIALALYLAGEVDNIAEAYADHMQLDNSLIHQMGRGGITLHHKNGIISKLHSSLDHHSRERWIRISFDKGEELVGYYPVSRDDGHSQYQILSKNACSPKEILFDEPLTLCIARFYRHFTGCGNVDDARVIRGASVVFHRNIIELIENAQTLTGSCTALRLNAC